MTGLALLLVAGIVTLLWGLNHPYANDSVGYLQEAQGLLEGRGLTRATGWDVIEPDYAPFPLFPPGFSLAIAGVSLTGLSAAHAALAISWLAWLLVVPAAAWAVRPLVGLNAARAVGLLAGASPAFVEWGFQALADAPLTLFSILSLGVLTRAPALADVSWRGWALSGVLAGIAYLFRNAGAVLPLTVIALLAWALLSRRLSFVATLRAGLVWGGAFALCAFPLFAYNLVTFGSIQPYFGAHGTIDYGLLNAVRVSLWSVLLDVSGWRTVADLAWNGKALVALGPLALAAVWLAARRPTPAFSPAGIVLLIYALIGCALVVWGRSRFDWVETTLTRQFMPYSWALLALGAWALQRLAQRRWPAIGAFALAALLGGRAHALWQEWANETALRDAAHALGYAEAATRHPDAILTPRIRLDAAADAA
ncbi:MAG: glycosyltransferase family 39 protein, partial [Thiobacillus sp.]|nr:glycosyltransferase family 39 protein [Thiobacillus sp.]